MALALLQKSFFLSLFIILALKAEVALAQDEATSSTAHALEVEPPSSTESMQTPVVQTSVRSEKAKSFPEFSYTSYGYMTFTQSETFRSVANLEPYVKKTLDLNEFAFEGTYKLSDHSKIEFEVEFEHGGVGSTMEYDPFEEFGEFEQEIEKGGEVVLKEIYYVKDFAKKNSQLKIGKFPIIISLGSVLTKPHRYPSIIASDVEARMIPYSWNEMGIQVQQKMFGFLTARAALVSGLNSEFFRTYNWVGGGYQRHFEYNNADNLATLFNLEFGDLKKAKGFALSYYSGNTTDNRHKLGKVSVEAEVKILSAMTNYKYKGFGITAQVLRGELQNSDLVVLGNATLGGLAKPKAFAPLGHKAELESLQVSYDFTSDFTVFLKGEHVNTFADVEGNVNKNPRYDVSTRSAGLMWFWDQAAFMKAEYLRERTELPGLPETYQASLSFGFDLDKFKQ